MIVILEWPNPKLSPNSRAHWRAKVGPRQDAKRRAGWSAVASPGFAQRRDDLRAYTDPIPITITFYPPDRRRRDMDNMIASMKAAIDGIADVFGFDDYRLVPTFKRGDPIKGGVVELEI